MVDSPNKNRPMLKAPGGVNSNLFETFPLPVSSRFF